MASSQAINTTHCSNRLHSIPSKSHQKQKGALKNERTIIKLMFTMFPELS
ncbi:hypothetical protein AB205_0112540 [Aquarana catesbeiana]|uniref:Uncharacterized protein n=1 Tax=Aquarana catesbeiana TaxID=8400 RepID=A0A2G9SCQ6_AQUCT|nr:hypothetical protein AB205_0112540 [Aquarana catesbeiana]